MNRLTWLSMRCHFLVIKLLSYEHQNNIKKDPIEHVFISQHRTSTSHEIDCDTFQILDHKANYDKRCISEMLNIRTNNILNAQIDTEKASDTYNKIIIQTVYFH